MHLRPLPSLAALLLFAASVLPLAARADAPAPGAPPPMDAKLALELAGTYRFHNGEEVTLAPFDEFGGHLALIFLRSRHERILVPQADGTFVASETTIPNGTVQARVTF